MPAEQVFGKLKALVKETKKAPSKALVLLHGVGSNEQNLLDLSSSLSDDRLVISLRAPIVMGPQAFAWFHVRFTENGPVHNWSEAQHSVKLIEESLLEISKHYKIALEDIAIFGFSQGAILTTGLALTSPLKLEAYVASSGRTLPEFAEFAKSSPLTSYRQRKIFVTHGVLDSKLPVALSRNTEALLKASGLGLLYKEYSADHGVTAEMATDIKSWLKKL
jgi:phospholipase/carboxylesterase